MIGEGAIKAMSAEPTSGAASGMVRFQGDIDFKPAEPGSFGRVVFLRGFREEGEPGAMKIEWWVAF